MVKRGRDEFEEIDSDLFYGEASQGIPHAEFDRNMVSWLTEKYGLAYGKQLWEDTLLNILELDLTDEEDDYDFANHVTRVNDILVETNSKMAASLYFTDRFWTKKYQIEWRNRQYEKLFCKVQKQCGGEALRQAEQLGIEQARKLRAHFKLRFGGAQSAMIKAREVAFSAGMKRLNRMSVGPEDVRGIF
jgi:hypothetical protein